MFTSLQGCGGWEKRWKLVNRCLSTAPRCDRPLSPSPPRSLARVCSLPSGGAEGYRSRLKFSMICSVTCSVIVDTRYQPNLRLDLRLTQVVQIHCAGFGCAGEPVWFSRNGCANEAAVVPEIGVGGLPTTLPDSILPRRVEKLPTNHL